MLRCWLLSKNLYKNPLEVLFKNWWQDMGYWLLYSCSKLNCQNLSSTSLVFPIILGNFKTCYTKHVELNENMHRIPLEPSWTSFSFSFCGANLHLKIDSMWRKFTLPAHQGLCENWVKIVAALQKASYILNFLLSFGKVPASLLPKSFMKSH